MKEKEADLMRFAFRLSVDGFGIAAIATRLNKECPKGITRWGWSTGTVKQSLRGRHVLGELQPHARVKRGVKDSRQPVGEPIKNSYPPVIDEALFYAANAALAARRKGGGRVGKGSPNVFNGILHDPASGTNFVLNGCRGYKFFVSAAALVKKAGGKCVSAPPWCAGSRLLLPTRRTDRDRRAREGCDGWRR